MHAVFKQLKMYLEVSFFAEFVVYFFMTCFPGNRYLRLEKKLHCKFLGYNMGDNYLSRT